MNAVFPDTRTQETQERSQCRSSVESGKAVLIDVLIERKGRHTGDRSVTYMESVDEDIVVVIKIILSDVIDESHFRSESYEHGETWSKYKCLM